MRRTVMILLMVFVAILLGIVVYLYFSKSVVWSLSEPGDPVGEPFFVIMNPFRNKGPERAAEDVLYAIKNGDCESVIANLKSPPASYEQLCEKYSNDPLVSWKLLNRQDKGSLTALYYQIGSASDPNYRRDLWIDVEEAENRWKVTDIRAFR